MLVNLAASSETVEGVLQQLQVFIALFLMGVVAWIGYWGEGNKRHPIIHWGARGTVWAVVGLIGLLSLLSAVGVLWVVWAVVNGQMPAPQGGPQMMMQLRVFGVFFVLVAVSAVLSVIPPVRVLLKKTVFPGLNEASPVHIWALFTFVVLVIFMLMSVSVLYDPAAYADMFNRSSLWLMMGGSVLSYVLFSFTASGLGVAGGFRTICCKLGLTGLTLKQTGVMVGVAFGLVVLNHLMQPLLLRFMTPESVANLEELMGAMHQGDPGVFAVLGTAVLIGVGAGVGEEILFRGLMQPVFGLWATSILFMLIHVQYGPNILLLQLLILGLAFGVARQRMNTTAAIVMHAAYDFMAVASTLVFQ